MAKMTAKTRSVLADRKDLLPGTLEGMDAYLEDYFSVENVLKRLQELIAQLKGHDREDAEPPRFSRRLNTLRGLSHEQVEQVLARGA